MITQQTSSHQQIYITRPAFNVYITSMFLVKSPAQWHINILLLTETSD